MYDKINGTQASVNFDTQREFTTDLFDSSALPGIGGKIYIGASDGKLTKTESDKLGLQVMRGEIEKCEWLEKIAEIKSRYPKV